MCVYIFHFSNPFVLLKSILTNCDERKGTPRSLYFGEVNISEFSVALNGWHAYKENAVIK